MPMLMTARGLVFVANASEQAPAGALVGPAQAPPAGSAARGGAQPGDGQGDEGGTRNRRCPRRQNARCCGCGRRAAVASLAPVHLQVLTAADAPKFAADRG